MNRIATLRICQATWPVLAVAFFGCTAQNGTGWATVVAQVQAQLVIGADHQGDAPGEILTDTLYTVAPERAELLVDGLALYAQGEAAECGDGSCQAMQLAASADDEQSTLGQASSSSSLGQLGGVTLEPVAVLPVSGILNALAPQPLPSEQRELGIVHLSAAAPRVKGLLLTGQLVGHDLGLSILLTLPEPLPLLHLTTMINLDLGPDGPQAALFYAQIELPGDFLDGIEFVELAQSQNVVVIDANQADNAATYSLLLTRLAALPVELQVALP